MRAREETPAKAADLAVPAAPAAVRLLVVTALLAGMAGLAGCTSQPHAPAPATAAAPVASAPPRTLDWTMADCTSMTWSVPVLSSSLAPYLPEGFQPSPAEPAEPTTQAHVGVGEATTLGFRAVECTQGFGDGDILRSVQSGAVVVPVVPPAELREERFAGHTWLGLDVLVATDAWRAAAAGWDLPVRDGGALVGPTAEGWSGALAMDRIGSFGVTGRTAEATQPADDVQERMVTTGTRDGVGGFAVWDASHEGVQASRGLGVWSATPGSWVAQLLGATQGLATFELASWDQPAATVHWPGESARPVEQEPAGPGPGQGVEPPSA